MAIYFEQDLDALISLLAEGGHALRFTRTIPESRGRSLDLHLENGVVVCWDPFTHTLWTGGASRRNRDVEVFLRDMCEGHWLPNGVIKLISRIRARRHAFSQATAFWLLRSDSAIARALRRQLAPTNPV